MPQCNPWYLTSPHPLFAQQTSFSCWGWGRNDRERQDLEFLLCRNVVESKTIQNKKLIGCTNKRVQKQCPKYHNQDIGKVALCKLTSFFQGNNTVFASLCGHNREKAKREQKKHPLLVDSLAVPKLLSFFPHSLSKVPAATPPSFQPPDSAGSPVPAATQTILRISRSAPKAQGAKIGNGSSDLGRGRGPSPRWPSPYRGTRDCL